MSDSIRNIYRRAVVAGAGFVPLSALTAQSKLPSPPALAAGVNHGLSARHLATLHAFLDRLCPTDELGPGAVDMGASEFIDRAMGDWLAAERPAFVESLAAIDNYSQGQHNGAFHQLAGEVQDTVIRAMEAGQAQGFANARNVFSRLRQLMLQGMFSDPHYGGNRQFAGWDLIGYPGAVLGASPQMQVMGERLKPLHTSAYQGDGDHNGH
jgi:gluconate 2-dehydrogenase gamma chain